MHHVYSTLALEIARDRTREAAQWRLADEVRRQRPSTSIIGRLRSLFAGPRNQPVLRPTFTPDTSDCA
jgi:hypothetical protein